MVQSVLISAFLMSWVTLKALPDSAPDDFSMVNIARFRICWVQIPAGTPVGEPGHVVPGVKPVFPQVVTLGNASFRPDGLRNPRCPSTRPRCRVLQVASSQVSV